MTTRRSYAGGAVAGALTAPIGTTDTLVTCDALTGWPDGSGGDFAAVIAKGLPNEEKVLCSDRTGADLTVAIRGYDGTVPQAHGATETIEHCHTAIDDDEANDHTANPYGHGIPTDDRIAGLKKVQTLTNKTIDGTLNTLLNIPSTAIPEVDGRLDVLEAADVTQDAAITSNATAISTETTNRLDADAAHVAAADPHPQYLTPAEAALAFEPLDSAYTKVEADARYQPIPTDTDWSTSPTGFSIASGWSLTSVQWRKVTLNTVPGLAIIDVRVTAKRTGAALTVGSSGDISGTDVVTLPLALRPSSVVNMNGPVSLGRLVGLELFTTGVAQLTAASGSTNIATNESISFRGHYIQ